MFIRRSMFVLICTLGFQAHADYDCNWAEQVSKDESWRIDQRNGRIGQLRAMIAADEAQLTTTLIPLQTTANRVIAVYDARSGANQESLEAVTSAIVFIQETLLKTPVRDLQLDRLKQAIQQAPAVPLADQLRDFTAHAKLSKAGADQLTQLANAVRLLENSLKDWQAAEQEVLSNFLSSNQSLVLGLFQKLTQLKERLQSDINALQAARVADQGRADAASAEVARVQAKRAAELKEIPELQAANVASAAHRAEANSYWNDHCRYERPLPPGAI